MRTFPGVLLASALAALLAVVGISACSAQLGDRGGVEGAAVDAVRDVDYVDVFRSADDVPNLVRTCVDGLAFASGSNSRGETGGGVTPIRVPEWDGFCATKRPAAVSPVPPLPETLVPVPTTAPGPTGSAG